MLTRASRISLRFKARRVGWFYFRHNEETARQAKVHDRPFGGRAPPAAVFFHSADRTAVHPERHLAGYAGILQADAYAGFNALYAPDRKGGAITEAGCWAHARRKLFELADIATKARKGKPPEPRPPQRMGGRLRSDYLRHTADQICPRSNCQPPQCRQDASLQEKASRFGCLTALFIGGLRILRAPAPSLRAPGRRLSKPGVPCRHQRPWPWRFPRAGARGAGSSRIRRARQACRGSTCRRRSGVIGCALP
jgi:hypothetical protein